MEENETKRILALLLCLSMLAVLLVACNDENKPSKPSTSTQSSLNNDDKDDEDNKDENEKEENASNTKYDYDLKEYITLPNYKEYEVEIELDYIQQLIDSYILEKAVKSKKTICMQGDVVNVSYIGYRIDENNEILYEDGKPVIFNESESYGVYLGAGLSIKEFESGIVGMKIGEIKEIFSTFPEDYFQEDLAGETVIFEIVLNDIFEAPIYNNTFVSTYFSEYNNTVDFEDALKKGLALDEIVKYINDNATVISYPQKEYNQKLEELEEIAEMYEEQLGISFDTYLQQTYGQTREEYIKAEMKSEMIYYAVAQAENLEVTSQMLTNEKSSLLTYYKDYYMTNGNMSEAKAIEAAKAFVESLGTDYIYKAVIDNLVEDILPRLVEIKENAKTYTSITEVLAEREGLLEGDSIGDLCPSYEIEAFDGNGALGTTIDPSKNIGKYTIINFWGTWCTPCKNELPHFDRVATEYKDILTIYAVHSAQGYNKASEYVLNNYNDSDMVFLKDYYVNPNDEYSGEVYFSALGGSTGYPYTVILDEKGIIIYQHTGALNYNQLVNVLVGLGVITTE
ncbi:MAG: redoxin domain-containing protein [Clostridia bacterium]|nr:redoxin domain-containing protein [Clostridia bacterium]